MLALKASIAYLTQHRKQHGTDAAPVLLLHSPYRERAMRTSRHPAASYVYNITRREMGWETAA